MRKFLIMAIVAVVAVAGFSVTSSADKGQAGTEWTFDLTPNRTNVAAASHSVGVPAKKGADGKYVAPKKQIFGFPKGSSVDTTALPQCKKTASDVGRGDDCPNNTLLGDGSANVVVGQSATSNGTPLAAEFTAFNQKNKILFKFQTCGQGTGPGTGKDCAEAGPPNIVMGTWKDITTQPKLHVPTPQSLLDIGVIITRFELFTRKHTKTVKVDGKKVVKSYVITPARCKGSWSTFDKATYVDGTSQTIKDTTTCRKS